MEFMISSKNTECHKKENKNQQSVVSLGTVQRLKT